MLIMCNVIMTLYDTAVEISSCSVRKLVDPPASCFTRHLGSLGLEIKSPTHQQHLKKTQSSLVLFLLMNPDVSFPLSYISSL